MSTSVQGGRPIYTRGRKIPDNRSAAVQRTVEFFREQIAAGQLQPEEIKAPLSGNPEIDGDAQAGLRLICSALPIEG